MRGNLDLGLRNFPPPFGQIRVPGRGEYISHAKDFIRAYRFISISGLLILFILLMSKIMPSQTKISEGYSTVLPAEIRKALNLTPGDILQWDVEDGVIKIQPRKKVTLAGICGVISAGGDAVNDKKKIQYRE